MTRLDTLLLALIGHLLAFELEFEGLVVLDGDLLLLFAKGLFVVSLAHFDLTDIRFFVKLPFDLKIADLVDL